MSMFDSRKNTTKKNKGDSMFGSLDDVSNGRKGRPKIPMVDGCKIYEEWSKNKHVYQMFGKPQERCVKCGEENKMITEWRKNMIENEEWIDHPYVEKGYWSNVEYQKYMKGKN